MHIISKSEYLNDWKKEPQEMESTIIIDIFDNVGDEIKILRQFAEVLRGEDSVSMGDFGNNLDALDEVIGDWFFDTWFERNEVYVLGFSELYKKILSWHLS